MEQNETVLSVENLAVAVKDEEGHSSRFTIEYGAFTVNEGDFVLIKGRNGCGKSTFLRLFHSQGVKYFTVTKGGIYFCDKAFPRESIEKYSDREKSHLNRAISYIGQEESFLSNDSAYSYIERLCMTALDYDKSLTKEQKRERKSKIGALISEYYEKYLEKSFLCSFKTFKTKRVRSYSGGQQKMINVLAGIIKARICELRLVLMDEPLNNLDGRNKDILNKLITELRQGRVAVIAITHCQIFDGINKVMTLSECEDGVHRAKISEQAEYAHTECLECYN